jgi:hypothetical protein
MTVQGLLRDPLPAGELSHRLGAGFRFAQRLDNLSGRVRLHESSHLSFRAGRLSFYLVLILEAGQRAS